MRTLKLEGKAYLSTCDLDYQPFGLLGRVASFLEREDGDERIRAEFPEEVKQLDRIKKLPEIINDFYKSLNRKIEYDDIKQDEIELLKKLISMEPVIRARILYNYRIPLEDNTEIKECFCDVFGRYVPLCTRKGYGIPEAIIGPESIVILPTKESKSTPLDLCFDYDIIPIKSLMRFEENEQS
jgi:hypothetical protein